MIWHRHMLALAVVSMAMVVLAMVVPSSPSATSQTSHAGEASETVPSSTTTAPPLPPSTTAVVTPPTTVAVAPAVAVPPQPWTVMLIGDSMAFTAGLGLSPHATQWGFVLANEGINGCGVVRGGPYRYFGAERDIEPRCESWPAAWADALARTQPHLVAVVVGRWELMDRVHEGRWTNLFDPAFAGYVETEIDSALGLAGSSGARVVIFTSPYYRRGTAPGGGLFPEDDPARVDAVNAMIRRVAERRQVPVIDVGAFLSPEGHYAREVSGVRVRSDGVHLTRSTGDVLAPWLFPQLQSVMLTPAAPLSPASVSDPGVKPGPAVASPS